MINEREIKTDFRFWIRKEHDVKVKENDLSISEVYDTDEEKDITTITNITEEGKEVFEVLEDGYKFLLFKEW